MAACVLSLIGSAMQYKPWLHLLLAWGLDFYAAVLLFTALVLWACSPVPDMFTASGYAEADSRQQPPLRDVVPSEPSGSL